MSIESPNDVVRRLRESHPRSWFVQQSGGKLTHAKVSNIEKGREPASWEIDAIMALPGAVLTNDSTSTPELTPEDEVAVDLGFHPHMQVMTPEEATAVVKDEAPVPSVSLLDLHRKFTEATAPPMLPPPPSSMAPPPPGVVRVVAVHDDTGTEEILSEFKLKITPTMLSDVDGLTRIGNSEIQTFKDCRRRWWLAYYRKLQSKTESPLGVRATGNRVHRALQHWYVDDVKSRIDPREALEKVIVEDWLALNEMYEGTVPAEFVVQFNKDSDLERAMIEGYMEWLSSTGADADYQVVESEAYVEADIGMPDVRLIGRLDVRVRRLTDGVRLFLDHKTVGDLTSPVRTLALDEQMLHYMLLEHRSTEVGQPRVAGAVYNMLRRVKRTAAANPPFYGRVEVHHNTMEIANFTARVQGTVGEMERVRFDLDHGAEHHRTVYPRPSRDCAWKCQFFQICGMFDDGSRVEDAIAQLYEEGDAYGYYDVDNTTQSALSLSQETK